METDKEKLTLKELAGYLAYGLKGVEAIGNPMHILHTLDLNNKPVWRNKEFPALVGRIDCKPILRPLSDLTKEITHNGETFVPSEYLNINSNKYYLPSDWDSVLFIEKENIKSVPLAVIEKLYEWHFAINIPEHLYIDINTI